MAKFIEFNKGWKIFGIIVLAIVGLIAIGLIGIAIEGACNGLGFVEHFKNIFHIGKQVVEDVAPAVIK